MKRQDILSLLFFLALLAFWLAVLATELYQPVRRPLSAIGMALLLAAAPPAFGFASGRWRDIVIAPLAYLGARLLAAALWQGHAGFYLSLTYDIGLPGFVLLTLGFWLIMALFFAAGCAIRRSIGRPPPATTRGERNPKRDRTNLIAPLVFLFLIILPYLRPHTITNPSPLVNALVLAASFIPLWVAPFLFGLLGGRLWMATLAPLAFLGQRVVWALLEGGDFLTMLTYDSSPAGFILTLLFLWGIMALLFLAGYGIRRSVGARRSASLPGAS